MDFREIGWKGAGFISPAIVNMILNPLHFETPLM